MTKMPSLGQKSATQQIVAEARALRASLARLDNAQQLVREVLNDPRSGYEGLVRTWAMRHILGEPQDPQTDPLSSRDPTDDRLFIHVAMAWAKWAAGKPGDAKAWLGRASRIQPGAGSVLHLMALRHWESAVEALVAGQEAEAKRLYRRAMDIGGQVGTPTNMAIQWTYAASFFRHGSLQP